MRREPHVRFCERAVVKFRRATHLVIPQPWTCGCGSDLDEGSEKLGLTFNEAKISVKEARRDCFDFLGYTWDHAIFPKVAAGTWAQARPRKAYNGSRRKSACC